MYMFDILEEIITKYKKDRKFLIPILQEVQEKEKYLPKDALSEISRFLDISENDIYSVAGFYSSFRFNCPVGHVIKVCMCGSCHLRGGDEILQSLEKEFNIRAGQTTEDSRFTLEKTTYSGCASLSPLVIVDDKILGEMTPEKVKEVLNRLN